MERVLRHCVPRTTEPHLDMDEEGWASLEDTVWLVQQHTGHPSQDIAEQLYHSYHSGRRHYRFQVSDSGAECRARWGHTIPFVQGVVG